MCRLFPLRLESSYSLFAGSIMSGDSQPTLSVRVTLANEVEGRWGQEAWRAVEVLPPDGNRVPEDGRIEVELPLSLHRKETEGYRTNLSGISPSVYVVLRPGEGGVPSEPFLTTVCPYEAQDYADDGDSQVDAVPMPEGIVAWVSAFVRRHHEDEPFKKRKRVPHRTKEVFSRPPRRGGTQANK